MAVGDGDGIVAEPHLNAVRFADNVGRIEEHLTVDLRTGERSLYGDVALGISLETDNAIGDESVHEIERRARHIHVSVEHSLTTRVVRAIERTHLVAIHGERAVNIVFEAAVLRHIHELGRDVAYRTALV